MTRSERIESLRRQIAFQIYAPYIITWIIVSLLIYAASCLGLMKMFEKAGEKAWKAWIPFYNLYILFKICWSTYWFWPVAGACAVIAIFGNLRLPLLPAMILGIVILVLLVGLFVMKIFLSIKVAKAYGKSIPWMLGIIFFDFIFYNLLGWGKSKYDKSVPSGSPKLDFSHVTDMVNKSTKAQPKPKATANPKVRSKAAKKDAKQPQTQGRTKHPDYIDPKPKAKF